MVGLFFILTIMGTQAQVAGSSTSQTAVGPTTLPKATEYRVVDRGPNHRVWQRETYEAGPKGLIIPHVHKYMELATGMHYKNGLGEWIESKELIEPFNGGAIARQGQYQVIFANNLNSAGAIDQQTPDGKRLRSNILGLSYFDSSTGQSVLIAKTQDSQGELISDNQVWYPNAFDGVKADVRYTYKRGSFEQDVILREQPPAPEALGLNPQTTEIEVITEFINPPQETIIDHATNINSLSDQDVSWGAMRLGRGKAFDLLEKPSRLKHIPVIRNYGIIQGRKILLEIVPLTKILDDLKKLPQQSSIKSSLPKKPSLVRVLPEMLVVQTKPLPMKISTTGSEKRGFVMDYVEINSSQTDFTFQGDLTYFIGGEYNLSGTTTFEGGTIIKLDGNGQIDIDADGSIVCKTGQYRPAIFTSVNDNSEGETPSGSSGVPAYGDVIIFLNINTTNATLHDLRFSYSIVSMDQCWGSPPAMLDLWNCQFMNVDIAIYAYDLALHNVLISRSGNNDTAVCVEGPSMVGENVTADGGYAFIEADYFGGTIALTNCLVTGQPLISPSGYPITPLTNSTAWIPSPASPIYQSVGAASYYLPTNSPFHNAGTTGISPTLLWELAGKTTYPPIVYSNTTFSVATIFGPQALRDNFGNPDLGYHYDPFDYVFGGVDVFSNITFGAGTAVGSFELPGSGGAGYGISIYDHVVLSLNGTATHPCTLARYSTVQEGGNGQWLDKGWLGSITGQSLSGGYGMNPDDAGQVWANFTRHAALSSDPGAYREYNALIKVVANNSEFWSSGVGAYWVFLNFTNTLFDRSSFGVVGGNSAICGMRNCTMHGGSITLLEYGQTWPVWIEDCAFDGTSLQVEDNSGGDTNLTYCDFNAFVTNANRLPMIGTHDVIVTNFAWQASWLGIYYLPTASPIIDAGSTPADRFGLYHYTTQTGQLKETNSIVDIGFHYVATDAYGNPIDSNGDGIPDYLEDANGNGVVDSGEINWNVYDSEFRVLISRPRNGSSLP